MIEMVVERGFCERADSRWWASSKEFLEVNNEEFGKVV